MLTIVYNVNTLLLSEVDYYMSFIWKEKNWNSYFLLSLILESLLVLKIYPMSGKLHIVLFLLYFCVTGIKKNIDNSIQFLKKYWFIIVFLVLWIMHFGLRSGNTNLAVIFFLYFYAGYLSGFNNINYMKCGKYFVICFAPVLVISLILHVLQINPLLSYFGAANVFSEYTKTRLVSIFAHPIPAACIFNVYAIFSLATIKNKILKYGCFFLGLICLFLSGSRGCMLAFMVILVLIFIINKEILKRLFKEYGTSRNILLCLVILILLCVVLYQIPSVNHQIEIVLRRITGAKSEMGNGFYRFVAWRVMLTIAWPSASLGTKLLGGGYQSCLSAMTAAGNEFINSTQAGNAAGLLLGTVDNTYLSLLYDGGLLAIIIVFGILSFTIYKLVKGDINQKYIALVILSLSICALTFDMQYWSTITFVYLYMFGLLLGSCDKENKSIKMY